VAYATGYFTPWCESSTYGTTFSTSYSQLWFDEDSNNAEVAGAWYWAARYLYDQYRYNYWVQTTDHYYVWVTTEIQDPTGWWSRIDGKYMGDCYQEAKGACADLAYQLPDAE
jgi:hypothetical protein